MAKYVGKRIVPKHEGVWDRSRSYEPLMIVLAPNGDSYTSCRDVPAGTALENEVYWAKSGVFNAQLKETYDRMNEDFEKKHEEIRADLAAEKAFVTQTADEMKSKTQAAVNTSNQNRSEMEKRMEVIEARQAANVGASTKPNADYAAELVDARVGADGYTYPSAGDAVRAAQAPAEFGDALAAWGWTNGIATETGKHIPMTGWVCAYMMPVTGSKVMVNGRLAFMNGREDYYNIMCYDRDRKCLGGCLRVTDSNTVLHNKVVDLLPGTAFISLSTNGGMEDEVRLYLMPNTEVVNLMNDYVTTWQWMNSRVEISWVENEEGTEGGTHHLTVTFPNVTHLCRRTNGSNYHQLRFPENTLFEMDFNLTSWWMIAADEEGVKVIPTDGNFGNRFNASRYVLAVFYVSTPVYAIQSSGGTLINGVEYSTLAPMANELVRIQKHLVHSVFLEYGGIELDTVNETIRITDRILAVGDMSPFFFLFPGEAYPMQPVAQRTHMQILAYDAGTDQINFYDQNTFPKLGSNGYYIAAWYMGQLWYPHMSPGMTFTVDGKTQKAGELFASEEHNTYVEKRYKSLAEKVENRLWPYATHTMYLGQGCFAIDTEAATIQVKERILGVMDNDQFYWIEPDEEPQPFVFENPSGQMCILGYDMKDKVLSMYSTSQFRALGGYGYYIASWYQDKFWAPHMNPSMNVEYNGTDKVAGELFRENRTNTFVEDRYKKHFALETAMAKNGDFLVPYTMTSSDHDVPVHCVWRSDTMYPPLSAGDYINVRPLQVVGSASKSLAVFGMYGNKQEEGYDALGDVAEGKFARFKTERPYHHVQIAFSSPVPVGTAGGYTVGYSQTKGGNASVFDYQTYARTHHDFLAVGKSAECTLTWDYDAKTLTVGEKGFIFGSRAFVRCADMEERTLDFSKEIQSTTKVIVLNCGTRKLSVKEMNATLEEQDMVIAVPWCNTDNIQEIIWQVGENRDAEKALEVRIKELENRADRISGSEIISPSHWDCMEGRQFSMFFDCLSRSEGKENLYRITNSKSLTRNEWCLNYTPNAEDTNFDVTIHLLSPATLESQETRKVQVRVHHKLASPLSRNVCICGDSLVDNNHVASEVFRLLSEDGDCTITQVGTRGPAGGKHEGRGSWTFKSYLENKEVAGKTNAFWDEDEGRLNFRKYCEKNGFSGIDYFLIALGTNDVTQGATLYNTAERVKPFVDRAKLFVDALLSPETGYPDCKIGIGLCGPGSDYSYQVGQSMGIFRMSINTLNLALIEAFDEGVYHKNVTCFAHGLRTDRRLAFPYSNKPVADRFTETSRTLSNSIHPSARGYQAWADGYYCQIRAFLEEDAQAAVLASTDSGK